MKELWAYADNRISVRFEYEWYDEYLKQWYRTHGNEHWEFNASGLMSRRDMSANDMPIKEGSRRYKPIVASRVPVSNNSLKIHGEIMTSVEIIENLYSAFRNKNYDSFRTLCSKDIEWIQNEGFPKGGHHHGADEVIKNVFQQFEKDWTYFKFRIDEMLESRDSSRVFVVGAYLGEHQQTHKTIEAASVHLYDIENQKVKRFRQFTDTAIITSALPG
jgi:ketosteroid isomerase-like protein